MAEFETTIEFTVTCKECGAELVVEADHTYRKGYTVEVEPCENCLAEERSEGDQEGSVQGYQEGWNAAKEDSEPKPVEVKEQTRKLEIDD